MKLLAIETSCDETAICIIDADGTLEHFSYTQLGNALFSQVELHKQYGGVFPSLAKREHAKNLVPLLTEALTQAKLLSAAPRPSASKAQLDELKVLLAREEELFARLMLFFAQYEKPPVDAIAVTHGPGLEPALWVGINFAKALSLVWGIPLVPVNHMEGHIFMSLDQKVKDTQTHTLHAPTFPLLALLISGGHTEFVHMPEWFSYQRVGVTRDDAIGEAFDKVARLMGLPYPGGPEISRRAALAREAGINAPFTLTRPMLQSGDLDFSFSGIKTAVRKEVEALGGGEKLTDEQKNMVAREFEDAVTDVFIKKTKRAIDEYGTETLIIGGGVAANRYIREKLQALCAEEQISFMVCNPKDATDNALMIALAGYFRFLRNEFAGETLGANGNLLLT
ncbi:MAG: tRNA (adenosine(37)-N6)-threonylcarbamoyltransferase complex transferase subunit TsaD [Candidatus Pacebacteria bacterium]|nr:tRNA (adenosine(37)-N6)-threonylcarbamoyltransferase complex transferase subunit TsaD [Candidatus Paceibacterota bacterium]